MHGALREAGELGGTPNAMELERVEGLNYSNGREMTLILYRVTPARL